VSVLDVPVSVGPALLGALLGVFFTRGYGRWTKAAAARDKARDELDEIMRWRWYRSPADEENRVGTQLYDERLSSSLRAADVPEDLISQLRDELNEVSRVKSMDPDRLYEVVDDIHIRLDEADRRHRASQAVSIGSTGTKRNEKSLTGIPA
jgi:hypothetical protein